MSELSYKDFIKKPSAEAYRLFTMGKIAAEKFLEKETPLTASVTKIAVEEDLTPEEVKRVCEFANHIVYRTKFDKQADKSFEFKLANAKDVLKSINMEKTATRKPFYPEKLYNAPQMPLSDPIVKTASVKKEYTIKDYMTGIKEASEAIREQTLLKRAYALDGLCTQFRSEVMKLAMEGIPLPHIKYALDECCPKFKKVSTALLKHINGEWTKSFTMSKYAVDNYEIEQVRDVPVKVINDSHPLITSYKLITDNIDTMIEESRAINTAKDIKRNLEKYVSRETKKALLP